MSDDLLYAILSVGIAASVILLALLANFFWRRSRQRRWEHKKMLRLSALKEKWRVTVTSEDTGDQLFGTVLDSWWDEGKRCWMARVKLKEEWR